MTIRRAVFMLLFALGALGPCSACTTTSQNPDSAVAATLAAQQPDTIKVYYHRPDEDYDRWNLWVWPENQPGARVDFTRITEFGAVATITVENPDTRFGFIVRRGDWETKDIDHDRTLDPHLHSQVYLLSGDPEIYTDPELMDLSTRITGAFLDAADSITFGSTSLLTPKQLASARVHTPLGQYSIGRVTRHESDSGTRLIYTATIEPAVDPAHIASLALTVSASSAEENQITVYARDVLEDPRFIPDPHAALGALYTADQTVFRTWSPVSSSIELMLFENEGNTPSRVIPLAAGENGLWEAAVDGDLHGIRYKYRFNSYGVDRTAPDIHTHAATGNSAYSVVIDLDRLVPEGWADDTLPIVEHQLDEVIYEIHVRDYSVSDPTCPEEHRGTYLGLANPGDQSVIPTGIKHLTDLGVTAVHLMPIHDFTAPREQYNWGYWTALFNVPESNYATTDAPGQATTELRAAVQALHASGIRVILDVVYNHTSSSLDSSPFHNTVPFYYHRTTPDGRLMNDSGTGNAMADERSMVREYIADSLLFWTTRYHVDGFRFDLLGMHKPESVQDWVTRLKAFRSDLTLYGEPWTGGGTIHFPKGAQRGMPIAVFNDHHRNAIRGDLDGTVQGFATGPGGDVEAIKRGVMGAIDDFADEPGETMTYVSAHDNLALWDKITRSNPTANDAQKKAMQRLALGVVLTSQGTSFLHGGSDFARTKQGDHNSYESGDDINQFDWRRKWDFKQLHNYTRGLVAIRRQHPAFRMRTADEIRENLSFLETQDSGPVAFVLNGSAVGDEWSQILVAYNSHAFATRVVLPDEREWSVAAENDRAYPGQIGTAQGFHEMQPYSVSVLFRE